MVLAPVCTGECSCSVVREEVEMAILGSGLVPHWVVLPMLTLLCFTLWWLVNYSFFHFIYYYCVCMMLGVGAHVP